ncbi:hypothetical protein Tco_1154942 [Tanacetum coccineum]
MGVLPRDCHPLLNLNDFLGRLLLNYLLDGELNFSNSDQQTVAKNIFYRKVASKGAAVMLDDNCYYMKNSTKVADDMPYHIVNLYKAFEVTPEI